MQTLITEYLWRMPPLQGPLGAKEINLRVRARKGWMLRY